MTETLTTRTREQTVLLPSLPDDAFEFGAALWELVCGARVCALCARTLEDRVEFGVGVGVGVCIELVGWVDA